MKCQNVRISKIFCKLALKPDNTDTECIVKTILSTLLNDLGRILRIYYLN